VRVDRPAPAPVQRPAMALMAVLPYAVLAAVLKQLPDPASHGAPAPWGHAGFHAAVLLGLMAAHSWCYARWAVHSPNRMLVNEFVARAWFVLVGLLLVGAYGDAGPLFLTMAAPLAVASWCVHYLVLRRQGCYRVLENVGLLGLFLCGLALVGLICVKQAL